jgi:hypothetical protein
MQTQTVAPRQVLGPAIPPSAEHARLRGTTDTNKYISGAKTDIIPCETRVSVALNLFPMQT